MASTARRCLGSTPRTGPPESVGTMRSWAAVQSGFPSRGRGGHDGPAKLRSITVVLAVLVTVVACSGSGDAQPAADRVAEVPPDRPVDDRRTTDDPGTVHDRRTIHHRHPDRHGRRVGEIWERPASPTKVMLFFQGGGACFSAETCGPDSQTFTAISISVWPRSTVESSTPTIPRIPSPTTRSSSRSATAPLRTLTFQR